MATVLEVIKSTLKETVDGRRAKVKFDIAEDCHELSLPSLNTPMNYHSIIIDKDTFLRAYWNKVLVTWKSLEVNEQKVNVMSKTTEYILLKAMNENVIARGFLLRIDFDALKQIEDNRWTYKISDADKSNVRKYIQVDIISKILMYSEDLVVLGESFRRDKEFYSEFLAPAAGDLGKTVQTYFEKVKDLTKEDILKMMCWIDMESVISDTELAETVKKIQTYNVTKIRNLIAELKDFGNSNHIVYKRFKHGGMPLIFPALQLAPQTGALAIFDAFSIVSEGEDPMLDIRIIPFSNEVLKRYEALIEKIQNVLLEMIDNRIRCIQREVSRVFFKSYNKHEVSSDDAKQIDERIQTYYENHPLSFIRTTSSKL